MYVTRTTAEHRRGSPISRSGRSRTPRFRTKSLAAELYDDGIAVNPAAEGQRWRDTLQTVDTALVSDWPATRDALLDCAPTSLRPSVVHGDVFKSAATWSLIITHNRRRLSPQGGLEAMAATPPRLLERARSMLA